MRRWLVVVLAVLSLAFVPTAAVAKAPASGFVPVPGGKLFYEERGSGPAVILIHGGMLDHRMWDGQVEALARSYRVIRYDVAGHGQSRVPEADWNNFEQLDALMQALKVDRASLVGLSMGGRIAIDFAIAHPGKVRALILVGPGMSGFPFTGRDWSSRLGESYKARQAGDAGRVADLFMRSWLAGPVRTPSQVDPAVWAKVREMAVPNALRHAEGSELEPPAVGRLGEVKAPTLVILGELDTDDIHRVVRHIEQGVPGAMRVNFHGVAHMPNVEQPAEFNRQLLDALRVLPTLPAPKPVERARQEMVEVEGGKLWVERTGQGEPVLLIHDGIVHAVGWDDVLAELASQFEVIRYDRRGYGRSTSPTAPFSDLSDLEALHRHLGVGKMHLVGSSAGGGLAIDFALSHPDAVASLTLVGAVVSGFPYTRHMLNRGGNMTRKAKTDPAETRKYWSSIDPYFIAPESKAVRERVAAILEASPQDLDPGRGKFMTPRRPALPRLGSIRVPTLVLVGEHDIPDVHAHAGAIASNIPNARREVIAGAGHVPYLERPRDFAISLIGFLQNAPFQAVLDNEGPARATEMLRAARRKDRAAILFSEEELNSRAYRRLADGAGTEAVDLCRLNTEAFPASANAWDSLGETLLEAGNREGAKAAYSRALEVDPATESAKEALRKLEAPPE